MAVHFERGRAVLGLIDLARAERMQQRPQDAAHMRVVVANQKPQLVEVDAIHGPALRRIPGNTVHPALTISRRRLTNGCESGGFDGVGGTVLSPLSPPVVPALSRDP